MRKWMRDRLKRRKKGEPAPAEQKTIQVPLQPKFYDQEPAAPEPEAREPEAPAMGSPEPEPIEMAPQPDTVPREPAASPRPSRRRRRGRTRRGGGSRPQPAEAVQPAAPEASLPQPVAEVPAREPAAVPAAASKGTVVLAIGLPGSGKSSWFKRHNIRPLSSDLLRELLFDDAEEQRFQDLVFSNLRSMLKARLIARRPMNYVDATNLTSHDRHSWIKLAKDYGYEVQGVFFDVPLDVCLERNRRRNRVVDEEIMRKMAAKLKAPTFDEGFSKITVVRVKQKE
jgi:predicted kinase